MKGLEPKNIELYHIERIPRYQVLLFLLFLDNKKMKNEIGRMIGFNSVKILYFHQIFNEILMEETLEEPKTIEWSH